MSAEDEVAAPFCLPPLAYMRAKPLFFWCDVMTSVRLGTLCVITYLYHFTDTWMGKSVTLMEQQSENGD